MSDGYDYGPTPGYGVGGPPPLSAVGPILFILLIAILVAAGVAAGIRQGRQMERKKLQDQREKTAGIIFAAVRQPLNAALLATGERVFAPTRTLIETIDLYLGPVIQLSGAVGPIQALRKALTTTQKEVEIKHGAQAVLAAGQAGYAIAAPQPTIILTTPVVGAPGGATATSAGGASVASATSTGGSGVHVIQPAQPLIVAPATPQGTPTAGQAEVQPVAQGVATPVNHGQEPKKEKIDLSLKEQSRNVREALEALSDYWQEDRVRDQIIKAQAALLIHEKIGTTTEKAAERAALFTPRPVAGARNTGSLLRPNPKPKT